MDLFLLSASIVVALIDITAIIINLALKKDELFGRSPLVFKITKVFLVPALATIYLQLVPKINIPVVLFMVFSWIGDIFLIGSDLLCTGLGALGFGMAHVSLLFYFHVHWKAVPTFAYLMMIPGFLLHFAYLVPKFRFKTITEYGAVLYCSLLQFGYISSAGRSYEYPLNHPSLWLCWVGYCFFLTSDYYLIKKELEIDPAMHRIEIMSTYAIAQALIIMGCACGY